MAEREGAAGPFAAVRQTLTRDEVLRRLVHASGSAVPGLWVVGVAEWWQVTALLAAGVVIALALETVRLVVGLDWAIYRHLTREYEQDNLAGYALYFLSSAPVAAVFEPHVAAPAILMLALGDPVSGLLGASELRSVKRPFVLLAMFGVCTLVAAPFLLPAVAILGAVAATVADGVKPVVGDYVVDDNLTIPPAAAVTMTAALAIGPPLA